MNVKTFFFFFFRLRAHRSKVTAHFCLGHSSSLILELTNKSIFFIILLKFYRRVSTLSFDLFSEIPALSVSLESLL